MAQQQGRNVQASIIVVLLLILRSHVIHMCRSLNDKRMDNYMCMSVCILNYIAIINIPAEFSAACTACDLEVHIIGKAAHLASACAMNHLRCSCRRVHFCIGTCAAKVFIVAATAFACLFIATAVQ